MKVPIGTPSPTDEEQAKTIELLQQQGDWLDPEIELRNFDDRFIHRKVELNPQDGTGHVNLT